MEKIVDVVAPKNMWGWLAITLCFIAAIYGDHLLTLHLLGYPIEPGAEFLVTLIVSLPFLVFFLALVARLNTLQAELARLALTDMLTGLPNRRAFLDRVGEEGREGVILMLDIDHFKRVNDTYGNAVGDDVLRAVAARLRDLVREEDLVGRIGGEEFAIFLVGARPARASEIGRRLTAGVQMRRAGEGGVEAGPSVTLSIGASMGRTGSRFAESFERADRALYRAKQAGRARLEFWSGSEALPPA